MIGALRGGWGPAVARSAAAAALAVGLVTAALALLGYAPGTALGALARGAFGDGAAWTATLLKTTPLLVAGLAVALSFRAGAWNIGAEGQLLVGALAATAVATRVLPGAPAPVGVPLGIAAGALAGAAFGAVAGLLRARRGVNEVISTILLNFVAIQLVAWAVHGPLQEAAHAYPQSDALPVGARLPAWGRLHLGVPLAFVLAAGVQLLLWRTAPGLRLRAAGLAPEAARFAGIAPEGQALRALTISGAIAGLAGVFEVAGVTGRLYEGISPGHGYTAIAVALLARLHPLAVVAAALFFGALEAGAGAMQREAGVPSVVTEIVQGLVILLSVGLAWSGARRSGGVAVPAAPGEAA